MHLKTDTNGIFYRARDHLSAIDSDNVCDYVDKYNLSV
jgi:hypothetical protein